MDICRYCGQANGHTGECPTQQPLSKQDVSATPDQRIATARQHFREASEDRKKEVMDAVARRELKRPEDHKAGKEEIDEAREIIAELLEATDTPKVTVDRAHLESILKDGLRQRPTAYQKEVAAIVGTLGRDPLLPKGEDRVILELRLGPGDVTPRFTGPTRTFDGIVAVQGTYVPPDKIRVIDPKAPPSEERPEAA